MITFSPKAVTKDLLLNLPDRSKRVLVDRYGLSPNSDERTLDAIGKEYGITRERVRQIENQGIAHVRAGSAYAAHTDKFSALKGVMQTLGGTVPEHIILTEITDNPVDRKHLLFMFNVGRSFRYRRESADFRARWFIDEQLTDKVERVLATLYTETTPDSLIPEEEFLPLFIKYLREYGVKEKDSVVLTRWLMMSKRIARNPLMEWGRAHSPHIAVRNTRDFAYLALKRHGSPMHFTEVAESITKLFGRETHAATTHNELIKDERFVLVGRGIYALQEWGYMPGVVRDVIQKVLEREGPLTRREVIERVKRERYVKDATIVVNLQSGMFELLNDGRFKVKISERM